ncbi:COP9 signalosome-like protein complex subunit 1 [Phyllosticta capitalensis]
MAPNVEESAFFKDARAQGRPVTKDPPKFDFESYLSNYEGRTRLERLLLIGSTSTYLSTDALRTAVFEARSGKDIDMYNILTDRLHSVDPSDGLGVPDTMWLERKTKEVKAEMEALEGQLKQYKNNLIKESIRMGYDDLGQFYTSIGDHNSAMKAFARERDYCTSTQHVADMSLKQIYSGIQSRSWTSVHSNVAKIQPMSLKAEDKAKMEPICAAVMGLSHLSSGNFREAARQFLSVHPSFMTAEPQAGIKWQHQVLTGNDIAVYGGLCALASMDRSELRSNVLENKNFRDFLELEPHVRRAISQFCSTKYTQCLEILEAYRTDYLLDLYLHGCVKDLYSQIRSKSIVEYFVPFSCVTLEEMEKAFASTGGVSMEDELVEMIQRGVLNARINLVERTLVAPPTDPRTEAHADALRMAEDYERALRLRLLRINMLSEGLVVRQPQNQHQSSASFNHGQAGDLQGVSYIGPMNQEPF